VSLSSAVLVALAGLAAGTMNVIVGSGSLVTFPTLLAVGLAPVLANVSNTVGLVPGSVSGVTAYRRELRGQLARAMRLGLGSVLGGVAGAVLLLALPGTVFRRVIPVLIVVACILMAVQPRVSRWITERGDRHPHGGSTLLGAIFATGVYGGYFGAAQGVILLALLATFIEDDLQRLNGLKNVLTSLANGSAAVVFIAASHVSWEAAGLVAAGAVTGGQIGGRVGRRLRPSVLRIVVVAGGLAVSGVLFYKYY